MLTRRAKAYRLYQFPEAYLGFGKGGGTASTQSASL